MDIKKFVNQKELADYFKFKPFIINLLMSDPSFPKPQQLWDRYAVIDWYNNYEERARFSTDCVRDYTGRLFSNMAEMAKFYNLPPKVIDDRLNAGISLKDALTTDASYAYVDLQGRMFTSKKALCDTNNVNQSTLRNIEKAKHCDYREALRFLKEEEKNSGKSTSANE